jgi:hypothetical protein
VVSVRSREEHILNTALKEEYSFHPNFVSVSNETAYAQVDHPEQIRSGMVRDK